MALPKTARLCLDPLREAAPTGLRLGLAEGTGHGSGGCLLVDARENSHKPSWMKPAVLVFIPASASADRVLAAFAVVPNANARGFKYIIAHMRLLQS